MPRYKDEPPAVRVYTVCDESRYLIVKNVPALGCGDDLSKLFGSYGEVEECKPMDAENCEPFTDVYWIKFSRVNNARFAKRKLDESVFLGNRLQVSYAPEFESLSDTTEKLEARRREVLGRLKCGRSDGTKTQVTGHQLVSDNKSRESMKLGGASHIEGAVIGHVSSNKLAVWVCFDSDQPNPSKVSWFCFRMWMNPQPSNHGPNISTRDYFPSPSMNETVRFVREKLDKIQSSSEHLEAGPASKRTRVDNRRRI